MMLYPVLLLCGAVSLFFYVREKLRAYSLKAVFLKSLVSALFIAVAGVCLIPVLPFLAKTQTASVNVTAVYILFLLDVVFSYLLSYKRSMLYADQKNYIVNIVHMAYLILMNTGQLLMVLFTHNYYLYLLVKLFFRVLENVVIISIVNRSYPYLRSGEAKPLAPGIRADIRRKVGALFFHKVGTFCVNGTDNILISHFLGLATAGLYSNYFLVIDAVTKLFGPAISALTPSVGHTGVSFRNVSSTPGISQTTTPVLSGVCA